MPFTFTKAPWAPRVPAGVPAAHQAKVSKSAVPEPANPPSWKQQTMPSCGGCLPTGGGGGGVYHGVPVQGHPSFPMQAGHGAPSMVYPTVVGAPATNMGASATNVGAPATNLGAPATSAYGQMSGFQHGPEGFVWQDIRGQWHTYRYVPWHLTHLFSFFVLFCVFSVQLIQNLSKSRQKKRRLAFRTRWLLFWDYGQLVKLIAYSKSSPG